MKHKISFSYNWYQSNKDRYIVKTYLINGIPFTFDDLPLILQDHPEIILQADRNLTYTPEYLYKKSFYFFLIKLTLQCPLLL